jgi:hypothetical protein
MFAAIAGLPPWAFFGITVIIVLVAIEVGYRVGQHRRRIIEDEKEAPVAAIVAATLGLLAFILAFTFGLAASRFDARQRIVVEEANAIGTTYLRAGLLPDTQKARVRKLLNEYVDVSLRTSQTDDVERLLHRSDELQQELWKEAEIAGNQNPNSVAVGLFIQAVNETASVQSKRVQVTLDGALPSMLWVILYAVTTLTMIGVGYQEGIAKSRRSLAIVVLVLSFSSILALVADVDSPHEGFFNVSQRAMRDLQKTMHNQP